MSASLTIVQKLDNREEADNYRGELFRHGDYRVTVCRDGIQWLFQRRRPTKKLGGAAWRSVGYCVARKTLTRLCQKHIGSVPPELTKLPQTFQREVRQ